MFYLYGHPMYLSHIAISWLRYTFYTQLTGNSQRFTQHSTIDFLLGWVLRSFPLFQLRVFFFCFCFCFLLSFVLFCFICLVAVVFCLFVWGVFLGGGFGGVMFRFNLVYPTPCWDLLELTFNRWAIRIFGILSLFVLVMKITRSFENVLPRSSSSNSYSFNQSMTIWRQI